MNRCPRALPRRHLLPSLLLLAAAGTAFAQSLPPRQFPVQALRGMLVVQQPPVITMDGAPARLSPGSRIREANNMFVLSGALVDREKLTVNYTLEANGLVHDVWILTEAEARLKRPRAADLKN
jgi:hypothetical protein